MNEQQVIEAYEMGEYLQHPKNPDAIYVISDLGLSHTEEHGWVRCAIYSDSLKNDQVYVRPIDQFQNFSVLFS